MAPSTAAEPQIEHASEREVCVEGQEREREKGREVGGWGNERPQELKMTSVLGRIARKGRAAVVKAVVVAGGARGCVWRGIFSPA